MFLGDPALFIISMGVTAAVLFLLVYFVITISDLECDYINAQQCCSKLNIWVSPRLYAHLFVSVLLFLNGHWLLMLANLPMILYMVYEIRKVPGGNIGVYEPTEIYSHGRLAKHMRDCMIHLGHYLIFFFAYLYCFINALLRERPIIEEDDLENEF